MAAPVQVVEALYYIVVGLAIVIPVLSVAQGKRSPAAKLLAWAGVAASALANAILLYTAWNGPVTVFGGTLVHDKFTAFITIGASIAAAISLLAAGDQPLSWPSSPAYYSLLPLVLLGVFVVAGATDAFTVLASWLLLSVLAYVYVALPYERESRAAAVRYILLGAVATLFLALWVVFNSMIGSTQNLAPFQIAVLSDTSISGLALMSLIAALGFKMGVAPFHWWLPSVYGRANGRTISVVAAIIKLGFIALFARIISLMAGSSLYAASNPLALASPDSVRLAATVIAVLAAATMTYGNIAALTTQSLRAMLAYSSIAHVGYILAAVAALAYFTVAGSDLATYAMAAIAVQAVAYAIAKAALFPLADHADSISSLRSLYTANKRAAVSAAILLLSLLGMPPMLGFWGKLFMFVAVAGYSIILVLVAFVNSAISSGYYARVARDVVSGSSRASIEIPGSVEKALVISALLIVALGFVAPVIFLLAL